MKADDAVTALREFLADENATQVSLTKESAKALNHLFCGLWDEIERQRDVVRIANSNAAFFRRGAREKVKAVRTYTEREMAFYKIISMIALRRLGCPYAKIARMFHLPKSSAKPSYLKALSSEYAADMSPLTSEERCDIGLPPLPWFEFAV